MKPGRSLSRLSPEALGAASPTTAAETEEAAEAAPAAVTISAPALIAAAPIHASPPSALPRLGVRMKGSGRRSAPRTTARETGPVNPIPTASVASTDGKIRLQGLPRARPAAA